MRYQDLFAQDPIDDNYGLGGIPSYRDFMTNTGPYAQGPMSSGMGQPIIDQVGDLYHFNPSYVYRDKLNALMQSMPREQDYKPSKLRRIGAALASLSGFSPAGMTSSGPMGLRYNAGEGIAARDDVRNAPYVRMMNDWRQQIGGASKLADLEADDNRNSRILANEMEGRRLESERLKEAQRKLDITDANTDLKRQQDLDIKTRDLDLKEQRIQAYSDWLDYKKENPNLRAATVDGQLVFWNEKTGEIKQTGLSGLTDRQKINLKVEGELREIQARTAGSLAVGAQRIQGAKELEGIKYPSGRPLTKAALKELTPGQQLTAFKNRANEVLIEHPEWSSYITVDKDGVHVTEPSDRPWALGAPSTATYNEIKSALIEDDNAKKPGSKTNPTQTPTKTPEGTVQMRSPQGKVGAVKKEDVAKAKRDGYVEVK